MKVKSLGRVLGGIYLLLSCACQSAIEDGHGESYLARYLKFDRTQNSLLVGVYSHNPIAADAERLTRLVDGFFAAHWITEPSEIRPSDGQEVSKVFCFDLRGESGRAQVTESLRAFAPLAKGVSLRAVSQVSCTQFDY